MVRQTEQIEDDATRRLALAIQILYPRIYMACHRDHRNDHSLDGVSTRESTILAHLTEPNLRRPTRLARHLGIRASTLSEFTGRLEGMGLIRRTIDPEDGRCVQFHLTADGVELLSSKSVLDSTRLLDALDLLSPVDRQDVVRGLRLLAEACDQIIK